MYQVIDMATGLVSATFNTNEAACIYVSARPDRSFHITTYATI